MVVKLLREARLDLFAAARFYDQQSNGVGDYFLKCIFEDLDRLETLAGIHERRGSYFRILSKRFPYMICYHMVDEVIHVVAILDCRQSPSSIDRRLNDD
jgi:hypothetical protein